jgi:hypothetical protein
MPENPADHCRNPDADAALRRIARESRAAALCDHPHCRRGRRCRGPWERLLPEKPAALPLCLFIKVGRDLVDARDATLRLAELGERIKHVFMEEDAFPDPEEAARRIADLIETGVTERMLQPGSRRAHRPLSPLAGKGLE